MITTKCPICDGVNVYLHLSLKDRHCIYICDKCSNAFTLPPPGNVDYDDSAFYELVERDHIRWRSYSTQIVRFIQLNYGISGRLLDVGSSHGLLIEEANHSGFSAEGIEPSEGAIKYCRQRGLKVRKGYLTHGIYPTNTFDVVVMSHVLEHVNEPTKLLGIVRSILTENGVLCLCQTNYQGTLARLLGKRWGGWVPAEHYYHFSTNGISWLLKNTGFKILAIELLPLGYDLNIRIKPPKIFLGAVFNSFSYLVSRFRIGFPFQGDQLYVLAQKRC